MLMMERIIPIPTSIESLAARTSWNDSPRCIILLMRAGNWPSRSTSCCGRALCRNCNLWCVGSRMSFLLPKLSTKFEIDNVIKSTEDLVLVLRFGREIDSTCIHLDNIVKSLDTYTNVKRLKSLTKSVSADGTTIFIPVHWWSNFDTVSGIRTQAG